MALTSGSGHAKHFKFRTRDGRYTDILKIPVLNPISVWQYDFFSYTDILEFSVYRNFCHAKWHTVSERRCTYCTTVKNIDISCWIFMLSFVLFWHFVLSFLWHVHQVSYWHLMKYERHKDLFLYFLCCRLCTPKNIIFLYVDPLKLDFTQGSKTGIPIILV